MTGSAARFPVEQPLTIPRPAVKRVLLEPWSRNAELIRMKSRELRRDQIFPRPAISKARLRRDRKLRCVVQAWIPERPAALHLQVCHECIPVGDSSPSGVSVLAASCKTESRRDQ